MNGSHDRDQSVERLLRQSFKAPHRGVTDSCLDAETLAAWMEGGLSSAALAIAQSHVADCPRCQSVIGAMARTGAIVPQPERAPRRWLAWLVPLTAAAAAVALWVAVPRGPGTSAPQVTANQTQGAESKASAVASPADKQLQAPAPAKEAQTTDAKKDLGNSEQAKASELRKDAGRLEADRLKQDSGVAVQIAPSAPADQAASAAAVAPAALADRQAAREPSANAVAERVTVGIEIVSPDPAVRWRVAGSVLEHSINGGSIWNPVSTGVATELRAGAAPSTTVCWVVGRGGVVLLSMDGQTFSRVAFPEMTDLSAVRAADARTASVTTMDGRIFDTTDGGVTWTRR